MVTLLITSLWHVSKRAFYFVTTVAIKFHPDKTSDTGKQEKFMKITEAYETLKDPEKRQQYDLYGSFPSYTRKYDYRSQSEYNKFFYNGLYHEDPFVDTISGQTFYNYLSEGFHFINFYSPFCPPCQNLVDHWKKLAEMYKGIIKVGAVNCKYHNNFCYNSMRIGSYPSLLFYPNGKQGNFIYYRGERTLEHLDKFVMAYLNSHVHVPVISKIRGTDKPIAYVLGTNRIEKGSLTRIAYHLNGLVSVVIVEDDNLREKLTGSDDAVVVFRFKEINVEIESTEEKDVLKEIVNALPKIEPIGPEKLKEIRNSLRNGARSPWVLYFSTEGADRLMLYQMIFAFPEMKFAEVDCDKWQELCASLHVEEPPAWGLLKSGGAYQRAHTNDPRSFIQTAAKATNLHTLSASDLQKIVQGDVGLWVLVVVPHKLSWDHIAEPFMKASLHFVDSDSVSFGIMACTLNTDKHCRQLAPNEPTIIIQDGKKRHYYNGHIDEIHLTEFIQLLLDSEELELDEQRILEILDPSNRQHWWLVAYLPAACATCRDLPHEWRRVAKKSVQILGPSNRQHWWLVAYLPAACETCRDLPHEWRRVAKKLRPLEWMRVGLLDCGAHPSGFCHNVRAPTARLYPLHAGHHYTVSLQHMTEAPYILEWALGHIDDVQKLNWNTFSRTVVAEELNPSSNKKPWLVYFHSPRCYRCYEMYADFSMVAISLHSALEVGKVNCISDRGLCQHEHITSYPSLRLYLPRNRRQAFSSVVSLPLNEYSTLIKEIKAHIAKYDDALLNTIEGVRSQIHDEF